MHTTMKDTPNTMRVIRRSPIPPAATNLQDLQPSTAHRIRFAAAKWHRTHWSTRFRCRFGQGAQCCLAVLIGWQAPKLPRRSHMHATRSAFSETTTMDASMSRLPAEPGSFDQRTLDQRLSDDDEGDGQSSPFPFARSPCSMKGDMMLGPTCLRPRLRGRVVAAGTRAQARRRTRRSRITDYFQPNMAVSPTRSLGHQPRADTWTLKRSTTVSGQESRSRMTPSPT